MALKLNSLFARQLELQQHQSMQNSVSRLLFASPEEPEAEASVPQPQHEKDWSQAPFYSKTLNSYRYYYPADQLGFNITTLTAIGFISKAFWRSWNIKKAAELLKSGLLDDTLSFHRYFSGLNNAELRSASMFRRFVILRGFAIATAIIGGFSVYVRMKNENGIAKL